MRLGSTARLDIGAATTDATRPAKRGIMTDVNFILRDEIFSEDEKNWRLAQKLAM